MGRIGWALVGLAAGAAVGLGVAYVQAHDLGRINLRLTLLITVGIALAVLAWAHEAGTIKEPEAPPTLSLDQLGSSQPKDPQKTAGRSRMKDDA